MSWVSRLFGRGGASGAAPAVATPTAQPKPVPSEPAARDWREMAAFVADDVIVPAGLGEVDVSGLSEVKFVRVEDYCLGQTGRAFEHATGGLFLGLLDGQRGSFVFGERLPESPVDLSDEDIAAFFPAGTELLKIDRDADDARILVRAVLADALIGNAEVGRVVLTLYRSPIDPAWIAQVTVVRAAKPEKAAE